MINRYIFVDWPEAKLFDDSDPSLIYPAGESASIFVREDLYLSVMMLARIMDGCNMDTIHKSLEKLKKDMNYGVNNEHKKCKSKRKKTTKPST